MLEVSNLAIQSSFYVCLEPQIFWCAIIYVLSLELEVSKMKEHKEAWKILSKAVVTPETGQLYYEAVCHASDLTPCKIVAFS